MDHLADLMEDPEFEPTRRQVGLKLLLHRRTPAPVLAKISPSTLFVLENYIRPYTLDELTAWVGECAGFWEWLLAADETEISLYQARKQAAAILIDTLHAQDVDSDGKIDTKVRALKLRAAATVLKDGTPQTKHVSNQTVKFAGVPKRLASMSMEELEHKYAKLTEAQSE